MAVTGWGKWGAPAGGTSFRILLADGTYQEYDVTAATVTDGEATFFAVYGVPGGYQHATEEVLSHLLASADRAEALRPVLDVFDWEPNDAQITIAWFEPGVGHRFVSTGVPAELTGGVAHAGRAVGHGPLDARVGARRRHAHPRCRPPRAGSSQPAREPLGGAGGRRGHGRPRPHHRVEPRRRPATHRSHLRHERGRDLREPHPALVPPGVAARRGRSHRRRSRGWPTAAPSSRRWRRSRPAAPCCSATSTASSR